MTKSTFRLTLVWYTWLAAACGGQRATVSPTSASMTTSEVIQVSAGDSRAPIVAPGYTLQLKAVVIRPDGSTQDVTNSAVWQSSNPVAATVSSAGVVSAVTNALIDVRATSDGTTGHLAVDIRETCEANTSMLSLAESTFTAFSSGPQVSVKVATSNCLWTTASDSNWFTPTNPRMSGDGVLSFFVAENTFPTERVGHVSVIFPNGSSLLHTVTQQKPICSYVLTPTELTFNRTGGQGAFNVVTTPSSCEWWARPVYDSQSRVQITSATTGTGSAKVTYSVGPSFNAFLSNTYILVSGSDQRVAPAAAHLVQIEF
jgi:hypothetical protein